MIKRLFFAVVLLSVAELFSGVLHFEHADVVYPEGYFENAVLVGNIFETIRPKVIELVGNDPGRITIVLKDKGTISNGYTMPFFHKTIVIYLWPPESWIYFRLPLEDWYAYVLIHEFSHMCHLTYQDEIGKTVTKLTGIPLYPQLLSDLVEGVTVFNESLFSASSGRLNNPFFSDGLFYYSLSNFPSPGYIKVAPDDDYRDGLLYYNFTAGFYSYLVETYGLEKVKEFFRETSKTFGAFALEGFKDPYEKVFGKTREEIYTDWIYSLTEHEYSQGDLVYIARNTWLHRIDLYGDYLIVLSEEFGPSTSYTGMKKQVLKILDLDGKEVQEIPVRNVLDVKLDGEKIYVLTKEEFSGRYENVLWDVEGGRRISSGNISAFDVENGRVYLAIYDTKTRKTTVEGPKFRITLDGFIRYMDVSDRFVALLTGKNDIIVLKTNGEVVLELNNGTMKGPYVKFWKDGITFVQVEGDHTVPCYYDLQKRRLYRLASKTLIGDFVIDKDKIYYISYIPYGQTGGTGIYRIDLKMEPVEIEEKKSEPFVIEKREFSTGDEFSFRLRKFLLPATWFPMYFDGTFSLFLTFSSVENNTLLFLMPSVDLKGNFDQYTGFVVSRDNFTVYGDYSSSGDYSFGLTGVLGDFPVSADTRLGVTFEMSFSSTQTFLNNESGVANNIGVGVDLRTYLLGMPSSLKVSLNLINDDLSHLFDLDSLFCFTGLTFATGRDGSFSANLKFQLAKPENFYYDVSFAQTLFRNSAELFDGLILLKNTGNTLGVARLGFSSGEEEHVIYDHLFQEVYMEGLKFYITVGGFLNMNDVSSGGFYVGVGTSPNGLPSIPVFIDIR